MNYPKAKFERGDVVLIRRKCDRMGAPTFTVAAREYDKRFRLWFYRDEVGPLYGEQLLLLAARKEKGNPR